MRGARKQLALFSLSLTGAFYVGRWLSRRCLIVLTYHRVLPNEYQEGGIRPANSLFRWEFEKQIAHLVRRYHVASGEEVRAFCTGAGQLPAYSVLITFDDGYENNYTEAFPILQRYGVSAVFFLTTSLIGRQDATLWFDRLDAILSAVPRVEVLDWLKRRGTPSEVQDESQVRLWFKKLSQPRRDQLMADFEKELGGRAVIPREKVVSKLTTWDHVREMAARGMTIGSHTASHQILASASLEEVRDELVASRQQIEDAIGRQCWCFSYPNGEATDFRLSDKAAVQSAGYALAFTQISGVVTKDADHYALPRIPIPDSGDMRVFLSYLSGVRDLLQAMRGQRLPTTVRS